MLKYPWFRPPIKPRGDPHPKFGAYRSEREQFKFATRGSPPRKRALEAEIMDWADDITYNVHDLEDFYRIGMIPLDPLANSTERLLISLNECSRGSVIRSRNSNTPIIRRPQNDCSSFPLFLNHTRVAERKRLRCVVSQRELFGRQ